MFGNTKPGDKFHELNEKFKLNTARLAAYKAYHATQELKSIKDKTDFDTRGTQTLKRFNSYQLTEYNTLTSRARTAKQLVQFESNADLYPCLEWIRSRSSDPRELHLNFAGLILPINDPFWQENQPGNLWNCKCDWKQVNAPAHEHATKSVTPAVGLEGNPIETRELITDKHPYVKSCKQKQVVENFMQKYVDENTFNKVQSFNNGGKHLQHVLVDPATKDFKDVSNICSEFAKKGNKTLQLPSVNFKNKYYDYLFKDAYKNKCPDLKVDDKFFEFESYSGKWNNRKIRNMLNKGLKQSDNVIIDIRKSKITDRLIKQTIYKMINGGKKINEVWLYDSTGIRLLF